VDKSTFIDRSLEDWENLTAEVRGDLAEYAGWKEREKDFETLGDVGDRRRGEES